MVGFGFKKIIYTNELKKSKNRSIICYEFFNEIKRSKKLTLIFSLDAIKLIFFFTKIVQ